MDNKRPVIGMMPSRDGKRIALAMNYHNSIWNAGGFPVMLSYTTDEAKLREYADFCDGFLFAGGVDLDPAFYGETIQFDSVEVDAERDAFEAAAFKVFYPTNKPMLGICRGIQAINVFLGGSLYQHIPGHHQSPIPEVERHQPLHVLSGSLLEQLCGKSEIFVNSFHHQNVKALAPTLVADALSDEGYVEALHSTVHPFLFAVQFHPEIYSTQPDDDHSRAIFSAFINACGK